MNTTSAKDEAQRENRKTVRDQNNTLTKNLSYIETKKTKKIKTSSITTQPGSRDTQTVLNTD